MNNYHLFVCVSKRHSVNYFIWFFNRPPMVLKKYFKVKTFLELRSKWHKFYKHVILFISVQCTIKFGQIKECRHACSWVTTRLTCFDPRAYTVIFLLCDQRLELIHAAFTPVVCQEYLRSPYNRLVLSTGLNDDKYLPTYGINLKNYVFLSLLNGASSNSKFCTLIWFKQK